MTLDNDDDNNRNCSVLLLCSKIWKIIIDFLHFLDLVNLGFVCKRLREIALLNKKMEHYFTFSNRIFCLNVCNQSLTECFDLIFDRLNFYFYLIDKLYFQYIVSSLYESFQCEQVLIHLFNCSRSEVSFNSCEMYSMLLVNSACASFCSSIDHYFKLMFPESVFSKNISKIFSSEKNRRFGLKIFYESKRIYEIIKSDGQNVLSLLLFQSSLTLL